MKFTSNIGLDFIDAKGIRVSCFQLCGEDGKAHAIVDFEGGAISRFLTTRALEDRGTAVLRLARQRLGKSIPKQYGRSA